MDEWTSIRSWFAAGIVVMGLAVPAMAVPPEHFWIKTAGMVGTLIAYLCFGAAFKIIFAGMDDWRFKPTWKQMPGVAVPAFLLALLLLILFCSAVCFVVALIDTVGYWNG